MDIEEKFEALLDKLQDEYEQYKNSLKLLSVDEVIAKADEISLRGEILDRFECVDADDLDEAVIDTLLKTENVLAQVARETSSTDEIADLEAEEFMKNVGCVATHNARADKVKDIERD